VARASLWSVCIYVCKGLKVKQVRPVRYCRSTRPCQQPTANAQLALALLVYDLSTRPFHLSDYLLNLQNGQDGRFDWGIPSGRINGGQGVLIPRRLYGKVC